MRVRAIAMLGCAVALGACKPADDAANVAADANFAADVNAVDAGIVNLPQYEEPPPPPYVPASNDAAGENQVGNAMPGQFYYRDLPEARLLRGDWTVTGTDWFAVAGSDTPPRSPEKLAAFAGAHIRIDRQKIDVTTKRLPPALMLTDCPGVAYLGKDALVASEQSPQNAHSDNSREDVLRDYRVAVAEKELMERFPGLTSSEGLILSVMCSDRPGDEALERYDYLSGAVMVNRNQMILIYSNGIAVLARRDGQ